MTVTEKTPNPTPVSRDAANWAKPVNRLSAEGVEGAKVDSVTGKRVSGPLQGFGQLWQKTFRVSLEGLRAGDRHIALEMGREGDPRRQCVTFRGHESERLVVRIQDHHAGRELDR